MKSFLFLAFCFFLMSCQPAQDCKVAGTKEMKEEGAVASCDPDSPETTPTPSPNPAPFPTPDGEVPEEAFQFEASVKFSNFEVEEEDKVHKAIDIIKKVITSLEFRSKVMSFKFIDTKGLTNAQIYQKILLGSEALLPGDDFEMDLELELYYSSKNTVGYTYANTMKIWMNKKYFTPFTPAQVAGNIFHEWTHKLGFTHTANYTSLRDSSVPYAIGYMIRDLGKQYE